MAYNTSVQNSTVYIPFYPMFGRQARIPVGIIHESTNNTTASQTTGEYATTLLCHLKAAFGIVWNQLSQAHKRKKEFYNKMARGKHHQQAGHLVWLHSLVVDKGKGKLNHQWTKPYQVANRM